jgi:hypothetical protein
LRWNPSWSREIADRGKTNIDETVSPIANELVALRRRRRSFTQKLHDLAKDG